MITLALRLLAWCPEALTELSCIALSRLIFGLLGVRREVVLTNLARAFPERSAAELRSLASDHQRHLGRSLSELLRGLIEPVERLRARFAPEDLLTLERLVEEARVAGRGLILVTGHQGNFELLAVALSRLGVPLSVVSKRMRVAWIDRSWASLRARVRLEVLSAQGSSGAILEALAAGRVVGMVIDQHLAPPMGVPIPFFGTPAWTTPAPAVLARRAKVTLGTVYIRRLARGSGSPCFGLRVETLPLTPGRSRAAILEDTRRLNASLEAEICRQPSEWLWLHRRWKQVSPTKVPIKQVSVKSSATPDVEEGCVRNVQP